MNNMKVWIVAGSMDFEGDFVQYSGAVFSKYEDAVKYADSLCDRDDGTEYDSAVIKEVELR
jgi:hypothetical protein